ncbi:hypothetical protein R5R35_001197 [Gryllus longicercus]|uniref:Kinetochore protein NDC80 n=1 Tax=Gryllus longicercus TaxID=2509291 RepID=A0AAN9Z9F7_9ORTH
MNRKQWSLGQGRRSSAPKRFSAALSETEDKNKNVGDGKKSFIPRPTGVSSRSSSVEREALPSTSRSTQKFVRSTSVESVDDIARSGGPSRFTESAFTPKHLMKTHGGRSTVSVQRTVRKDTRPLSDRAFQVAELAKVEEYLVAKQIINPGPSLSNSMTLKLFVHIMNSLLNEYFPKQQLTLSNYSEIIPLLMRKLKYPGNVTRSWLVTANSSHSWHNVLGLLSWLVNLSTLTSSDLKYLAGDDGEIESGLDCEKAKKLFEFTSQKYAEWSENYHMPLRTEDDDQFFDDLVAARVNPLKKNVEEAKKEVQELENILKATENTEEYITEQKYKVVKTNLEKKKSERKTLKESLENLKLGLEKIKNEMQVLLSQNGELKQCIADYDCSSSLNAEDVAKLESETVALRNVIKVRESQLTDINTQCYSLDLATARSQGKLDEVRLKREAIFRQCTSQYINVEEFQLHLNYGNKDNPIILNEYLANIKKTKLYLDNILKEYIEKENSCKVQRNETKEKIKSHECDVHKKEMELQQLDLKLAELKNKSSDLHRQIKNLKEEYCKAKEKLISSKHREESLSSNLSDLQEELRVLEETAVEQESMYTEVLERMCEALRRHVKRCQELVMSVLR